MNFEIRYKKLSFENSLLGARMLDFIDLEDRKSKKLLYFLDFLCSKFVKLRILFSKVSLGELRFLQRVFKISNFLGFLVLF